MKICIIEDDQWYCGMIKHFLSLNPDYTVISFYGSSEYKKAQLHPDVVVLDYGLPDVTGTELFESIRLESPGTEVVILSGQDDIGTAVKLLRLGAYDYIVKNEESKDQLWKTLTNIREKQRLVRRVNELEQEVGKKYDFTSAIIGNSHQLQQVFSRIEKACKTNINVSISGETGTGKELVARAIHFNSPRSSRKFVTINVAAIPAELLESELFGHEKGAFTGAAGQRIGKFEEADKGTLFLDEIGEMNLNMQAKLLRVLQEREITRVGSNENIKLDVRLLCATHKNLQEEVKMGNFREDLFYRLIGLPIELPPLRERKEDILLLARHFISSFCKSNKMGVVKMTPEAQVKLINYPYPGNIRELKSIIELAVALCDNELIQEVDINFHAVTNNAVDNLLYCEKSMRDYNFDILNYYLEKYNQNVLLVAKKLDIGKSTIYRMLKEMEENQKVG